MIRLTLTEQASPLGTLLLITDGEALRALDFHDDTDRMHRLLRLHYGTFQLVAASQPTEAGRHVQAYFDGDLNALDRITVHTGGTEFQREVWAALRRIPPGITLSYGTLAERLGKPTAIRAVGAANGANPISIVIPCHRLRGADGSLTGYAGGLHRKEWLIKHEAAAIRPAPAPPQ